MSLLRKLLIDNTSKDYIKFADPVVEKICAENWGDGTGITYAQAARVKTLGNKFQGNTEITSFNEFQYFGCTYTEQNEFNGCTALNEITIPDIMTKISYRSFKDTAIRTIDTKNVVEFGGTTFENCQNLISAKLSIDLTRDDIPYSLFYNCQNLQSVELGKITRIPQGFFYNCKNLTLPDGFFDEVLSVGVNSFGSCGVNINNLYLSKCTVLGANAFYNCKNIIGTLSIPNLKTIGSASLRGSSISRITSLGNLENIASQSITDFPLLTDAVMPDSVTIVGGIFLCDCPLLKTVELGCNITTIGDNFLSNDKSLKNLIIKTITPPSFSGSSKILYAPTPSTVNIYVPDESVDLYKAADVWSTRADYIKPLSEYVSEA